MMIKHAWRRVQAAVLAQPRFCLCASVRALMRLRFIRRHARACDMRRCGARVYFMVSRDVICVGDAGFRHATLFPPTPCIMRLLPLLMLCAMMHSTQRVFAGVISRHARAHAALMPGVYASRLMMMHKSSRYGFQRAMIRCAARRLRGSATQTALMRRGHEGADDTRYGCYAAERDAAPCLLPSAAIRLLSRYLSSRYAKMLADTIFMLPLLRVLFLVYAFDYAPCYAMFDIAAAVVAVSPRRYYPSDVYERAAQRCALFRCLILPPARLIFSYFVLPMLRAARGALMFVTQDISMLGVFAMIDYRALSPTLPTPYAARFKDFAPYDARHTLAAATAMPRFMPDAARLCLCAMMFVTPC